MLSKKILQFASYIFICMFLTSCATTAYGGGGNSTSIPGQPCQNTDPGKPDADAAVTFTVTKKGKVKVSIPDGNKCVKPSGSVKADITKLEGLTIMTSSNPKVCWTSSSGTLKCVTW